MKHVKTTPVDENLMAMVGHCCGARFTALPALDDGIDFTPSAEVKAEMEKLQTTAEQSAAASRK